jgi:pseudouridine-5'-phosphate glycosidase
MTRTSRPVTLSGHPLCTFAPGVAAALDAGKAVVALESTIITHGMPYPANVETARAVEADVRAEGAVPATIAVFEGRIHVGLTDAQMDWLGQASGVLKLSRADLAHAVAAGLPGSTTVAATMIAAHLAGIAVFATGGIGGVHRHAENTFDISADLQELAMTPVTVVCAGAKAILDLPKTFEMLETLGVPVIGYGCDHLPAFWSRDSAIASPIRLDHPRQIADMLRTRQALGLRGGALVCNPVPAENEIAAPDIARLVGQALADAEAAGVSAKAVTPYLLGRMLDLTEGRSLATNIALIRNNARLAARLALELAQR